MAPGARSKFGAPMFETTVRSFGSKCTVLKKVIVGLCGAPRSHSVTLTVIWLPENCVPLVTPMVMRRRRRLSPNEKPQVKILFTTSTLLIQINCFFASGDAGGDSGRSSGSNRVSTAVSSGNSGVRDHSERPRNAPGLILNDGTSPHSPFLVQEENSTSNNFSGADQLATQYPAADNGSVHTQQYYLNLLSVNSSDDALPSSGNVTGPVTSRFQGRFDYIRGGNSNSSFSSSQANAWQHYDRSAFQNRPGFQDSRPPSPWVNRGYPFWNVFNTSTEIPSTSTSFVPFRILEEHINGKRFTTSASTTFTYYNQAATNIFASSAYSITRSEPAITNSVSASQRQTATPMTTVKTVIPPLHEESNSTFSTETTDSQIANSVAHPSQGKMVKMCTWRFFWCDFSILVKNEDT